MTKHLDNQGDTPSGSGLSPASPVEPLRVSPPDGASIPIAPRPVSQEAFLLRLLQLERTGRVGRRKWLPLADYDETAARVAVRKDGLAEYGATTVHPAHWRLTDAGRVVAQGIEARSAETPQAAPSEGRKPGPEGMRPNLGGDVS